MLRRRFIFMAAASGGMLLAGRPAAAEVDSVAAAQFITAAGAELIQLMSAAGNPDQRRRRLQPFVERVVDVDGVARFCLGRGWQTATPAQRAAFLRLFRVTLVSSISGHLGDYAPGQVTIQTGKPALRPEGMVVPTTIQRPNNRPVAISWLVADTDGQPKIADVLAEGVSLRVTQRSDYAAFLNRNGGQVQALIDALQRQVDALNVT